MVYTGNVNPINKIVIRGEPDEQSLKVGGTVTEMKPGRLVTKGTNDDDIIINSKTTTPVGWLSYEATHAVSKPVDPDTAYSDGDWATVINGPMVLRGYVSEAVNKGDLLCGDDDGKARKYYPGAVKTMVIPFTKQTSEYDSTYDLPEGAVVLGAFVEVVDEVASSTIDVGILSSESGGDADGFIDGMSCATAGKIVPISWDGVCDGTAVSVSYTTSDHAITGNIHIFYAEPGAADEPVAKAEETVAAAGNCAMRSLI